MHRSELGAARSNKTKLACGTGTPVVKEVRVGVLSQWGLPDVGARRANAGMAGVSEITSDGTATTTKPTTPMTTSKPSADAS